MKSRIIVIVLSLVMILSLIPALSAQEIDTCLGLSPDDCAMIQAAEKATADTTSFAMEYDFSMSVTGLAAMDPTATDISVTSSGNGFAQQAESLIPANFSLDLVGAVDAGPDSMSGDAKIALVADVLYFFDASSEMWLGIPLADQLGEMGELGDLSAMMEMGEEDMAAMMPPEMVEMVNGLLAIPGFITYERLGNEMDMSPFSLTIDVAPLLTAPEFNTILEEAGEAAGDPSIAMFGAILPMLVQEGKINVTEWVGSDGLVHQMSVTLDVTIDASAVAPEATEPIVIDFNLTVKLSQFNEAFDITAPEGATMVDPSGMGF